MLKSMKLKKLFYIKLLFLLVPVLGLFLWPTLESHQSSGGGGSYDLTKAYAGIFMLCYIAMFVAVIFLMLIILSFMSKPQNYKENGIILAIGVLLWISSFIILSETWLH